MTDCVRPLFPLPGASREWHAPRIKSFTTLTYCEETIGGPLEIASEDRAEREGRCASCATRLPASSGLAAANGNGAIKKAVREKPVGSANPEASSNNGSGPEALCPPVAARKG